jgi:hypothetical protein
MGIEFVKNDLNATIPMSLKFHEDDWPFEYNWEYNIFLVLLESPWWIGVHQDGFVLFKPLVQKLLNIEQFFPKKKNQN